MGCGDRSRQCGGRRKSKTGDRYSIDQAGLRIEGRFTLFTPVVIEPLVFFIMGSVLSESIWEDYKDIPASRNPSIT